jgi:hypothetical protein
MLILLFCTLRNFRLKPLKEKGESVSYLSVSLKGRSLQVPAINSTIKVLITTTG